MQKDKILEGNKLIAEFMGFRRNNDNDDETDGTTFGRYKHWHLGTLGYFDDGDLKYHSSWEWLMPVVEKIEKTKLNIANKSGKVYKNVCINTIIEKLERVSTEEDGYKCIITVFNWDSPQFIGYSKNSKIYAVYDAVIQFVQWYQSHTQQIK